MELKDIELRIYPTEHMKQLMAYEPVKPNEHTDVPDATMYAFLTMKALTERGEDKND